MLRWTVRKFEVRYGRSQDGEEDFRVQVEREGKEGEEEEEEDVAEDVD